MRKKLIEVALPLDAINAASAREGLRKKNAIKCNINAINQISGCFFAIFCFCIAANPYAKTQL